jgi:hypothetical protein
MQTTHVGGWAVLYFYGEPWVPVLKNINWNGSSSGSTHKWNRESRFQVQIFTQQKRKKDDDLIHLGSFHTNYNIFKKFEFFQIYILFLLF